MEQGPKIRLGQIGKAIHRADGKIIDNDDVVEGIVLLRKGAESDATLEAIHAKVKELNEQFCRPGVKVVPFLDRSDLVHYTTHTVLHNLTEGIILVSIILFLFLGNVRGALIVALTIPFSLLFASICLDLRHIPANLLSLGALDFGMVVDGAVVMVENIVRHLGQQGGRREPHGAHPRGGARSAAAGVLRHRHHHHRLSAHLHAAARGRPSVQADGLDGGVRAARRVDVFDGAGAGAGELPVPQGREEWHNPVLVWLTERYRAPLRAGDRSIAGSRSVWRWRCVAGRRICWLERHHRFRVSAASGRRRHLGARHAGAQHRPHRRHPADEPGARHSASFPEVTQVVSQVGRPDDGTDTTGFFNTEYFVDLKPKDQWRPVFHQNKDELIAAMDRELEKIPGVLWNFSQPIADNMEEAVSGVKGELAVKIYGDDLKTLEAKGDQIVNVMRTSRASRTSGCFA